MKTNFEIRELIYIFYEGRYIDLHNDFIFSGHSYNATSKSLTMTWTKLSDAWVPESEFETLELEHHGVSYIEINSKNFDNEALTTSEITFYPSLEREVNDSFKDQAKPGEEDDILYVFENGNYIRIGCNSAHLKIG